MEKVDVKPLSFLLSSAEQQIIKSVRDLHYGTVAVQVREGKPTLIKKETTEIIDS